MKTHWATFISLADFQRVAEAGVSHVRLPVAYWYWDVEEGEPFPAPNMDENDEYSPLYYIKQAFSWAAQTGMKVKLSSSKLNVLWLLLGILSLGNLMPKLC